MIAYLSGPIENAENDGADWRLSMTHWLKDEINHNVFNPVEATRGTISGITNDDFREMKKTEPEKYKKLVRKIIDIDIKAVVENSDYLIVNWDESVFKGGGTHGEITLAYYLKKPVYLINHVPIDDLSSWIFSCSTEVFDSFDDLEYFYFILPVLFVMDYPILFLGSSWYFSIHTLTHFKPELIPILANHHIRHHRNPNFNFGITNTFYDYLVGTKI